MGSNISFIIQARTGSTRLPGKVVMPFFGGKSIMDILLEKLIRNFGNYQIILATTSSKSDDGLVQSLSGYPIRIYRGEEFNVLKRFVAAGEQFEADTIVRICADNPFLDMELLTEMLHLYSGDCDYLSYRINGTPSMKTSYGFFAEVTKLSSLKKTLELTPEDIYKEHVTNFVYENPEIFDVSFIEINDKQGFPNNVRFTVDTIEDFKIAKKAYGQLIHKDPLFSYNDVIEWAKENDFLEIMRQQISNNRK